MAKNIWIFHHYATPPTQSGMIRPHNFSKYLHSEKYNVTIFTASYLHYSDTQLLNKRQLYAVKETDYNQFIYVKTRKSHSMLSRILNMVDYFRNVKKVSKKIGRTSPPDLIIASSPHPLALLAGIKVSKKYNIPCISEVRDLWPDAIFQFGKLKSNGVIGRLLTYGEHRIYRKSSGIVFLKEGDYAYLKDKHWTVSQGGDIPLKRVYYINNGVDLDQFNNNIKTNRFDDEELSNDKFTVMYVGAIRPVNNVDNILDTAKLMQDYTDIQFIIYGDGNLSEHIQKRINDEDLINVHYKGYLDKKYIPYVLSQSSVNLLNYSKLKYNWSRGNSSNKLFEYMAAGKPIISNINPAYSNIKKYDCGIELEIDTPEEMKNSILKIKELSKAQYDLLSNNAYQAAKAFDYKTLSKKLIKVIDDVENNFEGH